MKMPHLLQFSAILLLLMLGACRPIRGERPKSSRSDILSFLMSKYLINAKKPLRQQSETQFVKNQLSSFYLKNHAPLDFSPQELSRKKTYTPNAAIYSKMSNKHLKPNSLILLQPKRTQEELSPDSFHLYNSEHLNPRKFVSWINYLLAPKRSQRQSSKDSNLRFETEIDNLYLSGLLKKYKALRRPFLVFAKNRKPNSGADQSWKRDKVILMTRKDNCIKMRREGTSTSCVTFPSSWGPGYNYTIPQNGSVAYPYYYYPYYYVYPYYAYPYYTYPYYYGYYYGRR